MTPGVVFGSAVFTSTVQPASIAAASAVQVNAVIIRLSFSFIILLSLSGAVLPALNSVYNNMLMY